MFDIQSKYDTIKLSKEVVMDQPEYNTIKAEKFMRFELLLFKIDLLIFGIGIFILTFLVALVDKIKDVQDLFVFVVYFGMLLPAVKFLLSIIRILKYYFKIRQEDDRVSIWRSAVSLLISPLSFVIYYFIFFILVIASCSASV